MQNKVLQQLHSTKGNALVSVMIAAAMGAFVALGLMQMLGNVRGSHSVDRLKQELDNAQHEMISILSTPSACFNTFGPLTLTTALNQPIAAIRLESNAQAFAVNGVYGNQTFQIASLQAGNYVDATAPFGQMTLFVNVSKQAGGANGGISQLVRTIQIRTEKDAANTLTSCVAMDSAPGGVWSRSISDIQNIIIGGGKYVGIGTENPQAMLDVKGGLIRGEFDCRIVEFPGSLTGHTMSCASDEFLMNGGGHCEVIPAGGTKIGFLHFNGPTSVDSWTVDCFGQEGSGGDALAYGRITCCKK